MEKEKDMILEQEMVETMPAEEATTEPEVSVTETTVSATPTSRSRAWMQSKYPDEEWADDAVYEEKLANHLEESDGLPFDCLNTSHHPLKPPYDDASIFASRNTNIPYLSSLGSNVYNISIR